MYVTSHDVPPDWPGYTDRYGREWRLSGDGFWWLRRGNLWRRADSMTATDIAGITTPPESLREHPEWMEPEASGNEAGMTPRMPLPSAAWNESPQQYTIEHSMDFNPPATVKHHERTWCIQSVQQTSPDTIVTTYAELNIASPSLPSPAPQPEPPNVPPDFAELPPGPGCCQKCHLDDSPLYEGGLCRYCWMLANTIAPAPGIAAPRRRMRYYDLPPAVAAFIIFLALVLIFIAESHIV